MEKIMNKTTETLNLEHRDTLADSELAALSGGIQREPTYHPSKVTVPDIKLSISFADTPGGFRPI
jgi:hypothetical protein